jgi:hypothetical protein
MVCLCMLKSSNAGSCITEPIALFYFGLLLARVAPCSHATAVPNPPSVQKEPFFRISYYPLQALLQIQASHGAACHNGPFVCFDLVKP